MKKLFTSPWALLAAVVLLRLPGFAFGVLNIDESDYLVYGAGLLKGLLPYRDLVEIKPPLGYFTYALAGGLSIWPIRILGVFWVLATALILRAAARRWSGREEVGWAAAWMSLFAGLVEVPSFGGESMMNLPIAGAIWFFVRSRSFRGLVACGYCVGLATLYKHQAGIAAVAFAIGLFVRSPREWGRALAGSVMLGLGALLPWAAAAGAYAAAGAFPVFVEWTLQRNLAYAKNGGGGGLSWPLALASISVCVGATLLPWALAARESLRARADAVWGALTAMLWLTWIAVAAGGRFYEHYFLQFVPPLAMLAAPGAASLVQRWPEHRPRFRGAVIAGVAVPLAVWLSFTWGRGFSGGYPGQETHARELGSWLRANTAESDTLFVWGHYSPIYTLAGRLPGTRYVNTSVHMGNYDPEHLPPTFDPSQHRSQRDVEGTLQDLERRKPLWFVDTSPSGIHAWDRIPLSAFPDLARYRDEHYEEVARPGGAAIFRRRAEGHARNGAR